MEEDKKSTRGEKFLRYFGEDNGLDIIERKNTPYYYPDFKENIQFILNHFQEPLFPRTISTQETGGRQTPFVTLTKYIMNLKSQNS